MASPGLTASPTLPKKAPAASFQIFEDDAQTSERHSSSELGQPMHSSKHTTVQGDMPLPLTTSKLANVLPPTPKTLAAKTSLKKLVDETSSSPMDELLARLSAQQATLVREKQKAVAQPDSSSSGSVPATPASASDIYATSNDDDPEANEVLRLKKELEAAKAKIAIMDKELSQSKIDKHTLEQAVDSASEPDFGQGIQPAFGLNPITRLESWPTAAHTDSLSEVSGGVRVTETFNYAQPAINNAAAWAQAQAQRYRATPTPLMPSPAFPGPPGYGRQSQLRVDTRGANQFHNTEPSQVEFGYRRMPSMSSISLQSRPNSGFGVRPGAQWNSFNGTAPPSDQMNISPPITPLPYLNMQPQGMNVCMPQGNMNVMHGGSMPYNMQRPIGTRLSPMAAEFSVDGMGPASGPWNSQSVSAAEPPSYMSSAEPMNYRRLLDRNMSCNWKYIVDKIVCNNDQQASIFLQQKLKIGTSEQKFDIVQAIIDQAYPLMINRFGNFLVQRCFEHGTPEQVISIARTIRGNTLNLSMDAFGCHVVQKAFDAVPEEYKAIMVHELLRRIPETVIHRYACHVWQKLFELRWSDSPPQIMKYVNEALRGMWHEVALGETGSLVVQNIFENCLEEDKRPCINEVLASIDVVAHGQFGNWCIQHICEHGSPADQSRAIDHVLRFAQEYSMDQFASKVIEKCLKIGGTDFLDRYLDRVCEARTDRPRMPLIDISGDQFGNYLIQYILTHADPQRREIVATHIRKHMVSLRGSKYGSRVAMLCCNPAVTTRPGPPAGLPTLMRNNSGYSERSQYPVANRGGMYGGAYR
ncbi:hypothetical protein LTR66_010943 [Elasticomyces elasticus]|nr:hypothetical protein LTR66_010943 [Elasticomyces elasticus]